jgi:hypothetical protein
LVREISPSTIICPGPDCISRATPPDEHRDVGYPVWFPCKGVSVRTEIGAFNAVSDPSTCIGHAAFSKTDAKAGFHPFETSAKLWLATEQIVSFTG